MYSWDKISGTVILWITVYCLGEWEIISLEEGRDEDENDRFTNTVISQIRVFGFARKISRNLKFPKHQNLDFFADSQI